MKKLLAIFLTIAVAGLVVAGCSKDESADGGTKPDATKPDAGTTTE